MDVTAKREAIRAGWREKGGRWVRDERVPHILKVHSNCGPRCYEFIAKKRGEWPEDEGRVEKMSSEKAAAMYMENDVLEIVSVFGGEIDLDRLRQWQVVSKKVNSAKALGCNISYMPGNFLSCENGNWKNVNFLSMIESSSLLGLDNEKAYQWLEDEERWVRIIARVERV